nr:hypothetical protein [Tanacetum cinerariifolium]
MYPEYIPLEDEHVLLAEEQPLPPIVSPTTESPEYDDADDEDEEDEDEEEEEEHLAPTDFAIVIPTDELVDPVETVSEIGPMTMGEVNTRVTELHKHDTQDLYALLEDAQDSRTHIRREMGDMQAELLALREQPRRARQPGGDARVPDHQDAPMDADSHI